MKIVPERTGPKPRFGERDERGTVYRIVKVWYERRPGSPFIYRRRSYIDQRSYDTQGAAQRAVTQASHPGNRGRSA